MLLDQIPVLSDLQRFLEHLSVMEPPQAKQELIIEQVGIYIYIYTVFPLLNAYPLLSAPL